MLDLGAESTRPGAKPMDATAEWLRLESVIPALRKALPDLPLSLDTRHAEVAALGLGAGIAVINDVTGFSNPELLELSRLSPCGLIAMRSRRDAAGFHMPPYDDPTPKTANDIIEETRAVRDRLIAAGVSQDRVLLDPGFGFGTTFLEDLALWNDLPELPKALDWPVERFCIGISRKRFLATRAGTPSLPAAQRDGLTAAAHAEAIPWGYRVFRTHAIG